MRGQNSSACIKYWGCNLSYISPWYNCRGNWCHGAHLICCLSRSIYGVATT